MGFIKKKIKINPAVISIIAIIAATLAYFHGIAFLDLMELKTVDMRFNSRGKVPVSSDIVLAVIDEKSIAKEGKWVWPRSKMAKLVNRISQAGAKVIAFDVGFIEADEKSISKVIEEIQKKMGDLNQTNPELTKYLEDFKLKSDNDRLLADAIRNSAAKVVLGYFFQTDITSAENVDEKELGTHQENIKCSEYKSISYSSERAINAPLIEIFSLRSNIKVLSEATDYSGYFNICPDPDGVIRWIPAIMKHRDALYAPLSIIAISAFLDRQPAVKLYEYGVGELKVGDISIPTDEIGRVIINYRGAGKTFPHIPVTDILNGETDARLLKDKIVLIGATVDGVYDLKLTPFSNVFPGVEIHATVIDSILARDFMYHPSWANLFDILAIIIAALLLGIIIPRTRAVTGAGAALLLFFGYILACQFLFSEKGWILNLVYPLSVMILVYVSITLYRYISESRQKKFIREAFSTYLAPSVVKQLIDSPEKLNLGGESREITAFFSDVQGFTSISERLSPEELVDLLNEFLTEMTEIILKYEGTVDKFEGDAIIAFFGAPNNLPDHPEIACRACIDMQKKLESMRVAWEKENRPGLKMRIGLCSGSAVVGNMGAKNRMDYTMMGDMVNVAARLEGVNKVYGTYTLISDTAFAAAGKGVVTREIDSVNVVGRKTPVTIYELVGYPEDVDAGMQKAFENYARGLAEYRNKNWELAIKQFSSTLDIIKDDGPSRTMLARCNEYKMNPPNEKWDGAYTVKSK